MTNANRLSALIVDDEPPARRLLRRALEADGDFVRIVEVSNGENAIDTLQSQDFDALFLDVQMPQIDGFDVLRSLEAQRVPMTVFVTAYDQFAVRAFEAEATDYILKPVTAQRLSAALSRVKRKIATRNTCVECVSKAPVFEQLDRITVTSRGGGLIVPLTNVDAVRAAGVYVSLCIGNKELLHRVALSTLLRHLNPSQFIRVHRSSVVNVDRIAKVVGLKQGECDLVLTSGLIVHVSRTFRASLERRIGMSRKRVERTESH